MTASNTATLASWVVRVSTSAPSRCVLVRIHTLAPSGMLPAALAATALLTPAPLGIAPPPHPAPTDCTTGRDGKTVWVYCSGGYGQYRVSIYVINPPTGS